MTKSKVSQAAEWYARRGYSVIPGKPPHAVNGKDTNKSPRVDWTPYQQTKADSEQITKWWQQWPDARIMLVTGAISGITVIDADTPEAIGLIYDQLPTQYEVPTVISPRGGRHFYFRHEPSLPTKAGVQPGIDIRNDGGVIIAPPSPGINGTGYIWAEGCKISDIDLPNIPSSLILFLKGGVWGGDSIEGITHSGTGNPKNITNITSITNITVEEGKRDEVLFHLANYLVKSGMSEVDIRFYLYFFASKCEPPFPIDEADAKIKSALQRQERSTRNLTQEVRDLINITRHNISITWALQNITNITLADRPKIAVILHRLAREGIIEPVKSQVGVYRIVEQEAEEIKWWEANMEEVPLRLPFDLHEYVRIMPKTISVIAGSQDAGKTALLLNLAYQNASKHRIIYLSSEMDANELASRLICLDPYDQDRLRKIDFRDRSSGFVDVIEPDAINIIDYYEISDKFYRISDEFKAIRDKLNKGVAFVALQKDAKKALGRGASFGMEKPRLYLTLDREFDKGNVLRVQKAKGWRNSELNPNGLMIAFWIYSGINLKAKGAWEPEILKTEKGKQYDKY